MRKIWPFTFNMLWFAGFAFVVPYFVLYYQSIGLSGTEIGLLTGIAPLVTLFSGPFWTNLADRTGKHRLIMSLAIAGTATTIFMIPQFNTFAAIFLIAILINVFVAPISSFVDSATMFMLADKKEMYGRVRVGGTIGFGLVAAIAGVVVQNYGLKLAFGIGTTLFFLTWFVSQKLVYNPLKAGELARGDILVLLTNRRWFLFLVTAFAGGLGLSATSNYLFPYMKESGVSESVMGLSLTLGTLSEFPVLFFGNRLIHRLKPHGLLMLAIVFTGVRLLLFAAADSTAFFLLLQMLGGLTFPTIWIAGVAYADANAPAGMGATAQGLFASVTFGIGTALGGFVGGPLLASMGGRGLFLIFGTAVLVVVVLVALLQKHLPMERQPSPNAVLP